MKTNTDFGSPVGVSCGAVPALSGPPTSSAGESSFKRCSKCGELKPLDVFSPAKKNRDGRHCWCRACANAHFRLFRAERPDKKLWTMWCNMKRRCSPNNKHRDRRWYYDRGVRVCQEWMGYPAFAAFARANGYVEGLTIDRIDSGGDYCPDNVQFIPLVANIRRKKKSTAWSAAARVNQRLCAESRRTKTRCVETGEIFRSRVDAGRSVNRSGPSILQAINLGCRCGGFHWENVLDIDKHEVPVIKCAPLPDVRVAENNN